MSPIKFYFSWCRPQLLRSSILLVFILLSSCRGPEAVDAEVLSTLPVTTPNQSSQSSATTMRQGAEQGSAADANHRGRRMEKICQGAKFQLTLDAQAMAAVANVPRLAKLQVVRAGAPTDIAGPTEMDGYTAVGLACAVASADSKPYFVVEYGELPKGCQFCEWIYLYDANGTQLTRSTPPLLEDRTLPEGEQQYPNNEEYEAALKRLGIQHPEIDYID